MTKRPKKHANLLSLIRQCIEEGRYLETIHAQERQLQRKLILSDILQVLMTGQHEPGKDLFDIAYGAWNYAISGYAKGEAKMRVIVSFDDEVRLLIITAFYIEEHNGYKKQKN